MHPQDSPSATETSATSAQQAPRKRVRASHGDLDARQAQLDAWEARLRADEAALKAKVDAFGTREAQLNADIAKFEAEKEMMAPSANVKMHDWLKLNVHGKHMVVRREVLCAVPGTKLEAMFSGRWKMPEDEQGRVLVDADPLAFRKLTEWLRTCVEPMEAVTGQIIDPPDIPSDLLKRFERLLCSFGFDAVDVMRHKHSRFEGIHFAKPFPLIFNPYKSKHNSVDNFSIDPVLIDAAGTYTLPIHARPNVRGRYHSCGQGHAMFCLGYPPEAKSVVWKCKFEEQHAETEGPDSAYDDWSYGIIGRTLTSEGTDYAASCMINVGHQIQFQPITFTDDEYPYDANADRHYFEKVEVNGAMIRYKCPDTRAGQQYMYGSPLKKGDVVIMKLDLVNNMLKSYLVRTKRMWVLELPRDGVSMWYGYLGMSLRYGGHRPSISPVDPGKLPKEFWTQS